MRRDAVRLTLSLAIVAVTVFGPGCALRKGVPASGSAPIREAPSKWFMRQRNSAGPIPPRAVAAALERARAQGTLNDAPGAWVNQGPVNIGGRVTSLAVDPVNPNHIWIGTAAGGVWDSADEGATWTPRFDGQTSNAIGAIATHPTNPLVVYVGTGEANGSAYGYDGDGVYKTVDGGTTWTNVGLGDSRKIGRIAIDPVNPERVFVAAVGSPFLRSADRGVYRSTNGGTSWQRVLFVADDTGAIDLSIDPSNPNRIYAALWQVAGDVNGGPLGGIWRSLDGGTTWTKLTTGLPALVGRIGIAIAPSLTSTLYATVAGPQNAFDGIYKSTNGGDTWAKVNGPTSQQFFVSFTSYFGQIRVHPTNADTVYVLQVRLYRSLNGGISYVPIAEEVHVDWHDLRVEAGGRWLAATDGGFFRSRNNGATWFHANTLPITQLYDGHVAETDPARRLVGAQDNYVLRTTTGGLADWTPVLGGDGLQVEIDPTDVMKQYGELQGGFIQRSTDGGETWVEARSGIDPNERTNWNTPITLDPVVPTTLYTGTVRVYRSTDAAVSWTPISPVLTVIPFGGESAATALSHEGDLSSHTITVVSVSPVDRDVLWAATDDGNVWVSQDAGGSWSQVDPPGTAHWVTDIAADPFERDTAWLTVTGYLVGDKLPYLRVTRDLGQSWQAVGTGLPELPINTVVADETWRGRLFVGNDAGVFVSDDYGATFDVIRGGMPWIVVLSLQKHRGLDALFAATHARGLFRYDLAQLGPADGDADGSDNNLDCAPTDAGAFATPGEVAALTTDRGVVGETLLSWSSLAATAGSATAYDLARGDLASLRTLGTGDSGSLVCALAATSTSDPAVPVAGAGFYYLARGRNTCGFGSWGTGAAGPRASGACP